MRRSGYAARAVGVLAFGVAFGYVEAAVVVDLRTALGLTPAPLFPLHEVTGSDARLLAIELGRELATLVMLAGIGWAAGARLLERLAWSAVAFGAWDIAYYGWLWVFIGWPPALTAWDVLFLVPVPWVAPVWAPITVSSALILVGLVAARGEGAAGTIRLAPWHVVAGVAGGFLVVLSFTLDAARIEAGAVPGDYPWPIFLAGMIVALAAAGSALARRPASTPTTR